MKKSDTAILPFIMLIGAVAAGNAIAQVQTSMGVRVGVNIADASYTSTMSGVSKSAQTGLLLGGIVEIGVSDNIFLRAEPMYVQNGATMTIDLFQDLSYEEIYKLEYLELPVHVKLRFGAGVVRPYIFGGPNLGILIAANLDEDIPPALAEPEFRQSGTQDIKDELSSTNFAIDLGGGAAYDVAPQVQLIMDVRYSFGLSNIAESAHPNDQSFQPDSWKSRDVKVLVGVLFAW